jgi:hypothetical protein
MMSSQASLMMGKLKRLEMFELICPQLFRCAPLVLGVCWWKGLAASVNSLAAAAGGRSATQSKVVMVKDLKKDQQTWHGLSKLKAGKTLKLDTKSPMFF